MTLDEFRRQPLTYCGGIRCATYALRMRRNDELGIQVETYTPFDERNQTWGNGMLTFYMDGDDREFTTIDDLYAAWAEKRTAAAEVKA